MIKIFCAPSWLARVVYTLILLFPSGMYSWNLSCDCALDYVRTTTATTKTTTKTTTTTTNNNNDNNNNQQQTPNNNNNNDDDIKNNNNNWRRRQDTGSNPATRGRNHPGGKDCQRVKNTSLVGVVLGPCSYG